MKEHMWSGKVFVPARKGEIVYLSPENVGFVIDDKYILDGVKGEVYDFKTVGYQWHIIQRLATDRLGQKVEGVVILEYLYDGPSRFKYTREDGQVYAAFMKELINTRCPNWEDTITKVNAKFPGLPRMMVIQAGERIRRQVADMEG